jgi:2-succinyl-5-enolpyruvyl-6-hydroxy-3-cyclohexene-1-carboxylate synthase
VTATTPGAANPSHAQATVVVDELVRAGVTDVVLAPGSRSAALALAVHDEPRLRLHVEVDERSAGFLAIGLGRATGRPAAVVVTSGSAVANLHPAVVEADTGEVPLLLLTADRPPELRDTGANQAIHQVGLFGGAVRWSVDVGVAEDRPGVVAYWRSTIARACLAAAGITGPAGPVQVNLPFREPTVPLTDDGRSAAAGPFAQPLDGRAGGRPWVAGTAAAGVPDRATVQGLARTHRRCRTWPRRRRPDDGARRADPRARARRRMAGPRRAGVQRPPRPQRHRRHPPPPRRRPVRGRAPTRAGAADRADRPVPAPRRAARRRGPAAAARPPRPLARPRPHHRRAGRRRRRGHLPSGRRRARGPRRLRLARRLARCRRRGEAAIDAVLDADDAVSEPRVARDLGAWLPDGSALVVASSMPVRDLDQFLAPRDGLRVLANRGASGIDGFVSTALGVALARGSRGTEGDHLGLVGGPTVALAGDLSLLHDANGFLLSPGAESLDAVFVVVDNDGGGIFHFLPQARFPGSFERLFGTPHGRDLAALATFHHLGYEPVGAREDLLPAVERAPTPAASTSSTSARTATPTPRSTATSPPPSPRPRPG